MYPHDQTDNSAKPEWLTLFRTARIFAGCQRLTRLLYSLVLLVPQLALADTHLTLTEQKQVEAVLQQAHQLLKKNDCDEAKRILDQSIRTLHAAEVELALVHASMQAGQYQQALGLAAHVQAEHTRYLEINMLYAWLLTLGGHEKSALDLLEERRSSGDFTPAEAAQLATMKTMINSSRQLVRDWLTKEDTLTIPDDIAQEKMRPQNGRIGTAPYRPVSLPIQGQWQGAGMLAPDGQHVLVVQQNTENTEHSSASDVRYQVYVHQHGLVSAKWQRNLGGKMALLLLDHPVNKATALAHNIGTPKPGQPVYVVGTPYADAQPTWPLLQTDVLGNAKSLAQIVQIVQTPEKNLSAFRLHLKYPTTGATVFNPGGEVLGLSMVDQQGNSWLLPIPADWSEGLQKSPPSAGNGSNPAADDIYELGFARQVLVYTQ